MGKFTTYVEFDVLASVPLQKVSHLASFWVTSMDRIFCSAPHTGSTGIQQQGKIALKTLLTIVIKIKYYFQALPKS